jgi:hypothetical protein
MTDPLFKKLKGLKLKDSSPCGRPTEMKLLLIGKVGK